MAELVIWFIQVPGWLLFFYLVYALGVAASSYKLRARMGTQEPAEQITKVGAAFWSGLAFAELVFYTPILGLGLVGHALGSDWAPLVLGVALGITVYWPIVSLATVKAARNAPGWSLPKEVQYWMVLSLISVWAGLGMLALWFLP